MALEPTDRELLIRIDERTASLQDMFAKHIEQDRADFAALHGRISDNKRELDGKIGKVANRQAWILGAGTVGGSIVGAFIGWFVKVFTTGGSGGA